MVQHAESTPEKGGGGGGGIHLLKHCLDSILGSRRDCRPGIRVEVDMAFQDRVEDLLFSLSPEWWDSTQEDVEDHTTAP